MNKLKRIYRESEFYGVHQKNPDIQKILKKGFTVIQPNEKTESTLYLEKKNGLINDGKSIIGIKEIRFSRRSFEINR